MTVYKRVDEDYKKVAEEQTKAIKILNQRLREKEKEIIILNKDRARLRNIIRTKKGVNND